MSEADVESGIALARALDSQGDINDAYTVWSLAKEVQRLRAQIADHSKEPTAPDAWMIYDRVGEVLTCTHSFSEKSQHERAGLTAVPMVEMHGDREEP